MQKNAYKIKQITLFHKFVQKINVICLEVKYVDDFVDLHVIYLNYPISTCFIKNKINVSKGFWSTIKFECMTNSKSSF